MDEGRIRKRSVINPSFVCGSFANGHDVTKPDSGLGLSIVAGFAHLIREAYPWRIQLKEASRVPWLAWLLTLQIISGRIFARIFVS
jgi:hypothetical protein